MAPVEIILSTILCAVPAFMREDPARTSAPTSVTMAKSAARSSGELRLHVSAHDRGDGERSASAAGDAKNNIALAGLPFFNLLESQGSVVFAGLSGGGERLGSSRHDVLHAARIGVESRWNLGGVESADAAAGPSTHIDQASTPAEAGDHDINGASDLGQSAADCRSDGGVFLVHESHDFEGRHAVKTGGGGKDLFRGKLAEVGFLFAGSGQVVRLSGIGKADHFSTSELPEAVMRRTRCGSEALCQFDQRLDNGVVNLGTDFLDRLTRAVRPGAIRQ